MIYTVTFNPAIDYVIHVSKLQRGSVNRAIGETVLFGGKGINVSTVLKELEIPNIALGFIAGFTGEALEQSLQKSGIRSDFISLSGGLTRINVKIKGEMETDINGNGPDVTETDVEKLFQKLDQLQAGDILVLAGSIPTGMGQDCYRQILGYLEGRGVNVVVDATGALLQSVLPYHPFLIKPNHHELGELFGRTLTDVSDMLSCAKELQKQGARNILVSMAGDGALLLDEAGCHHRLAAPKGKVVNSVGAGDSMVAGFLAGWLTEQSYEKALRLGTAAGSATAFSEGLATKEEILSVLSQIKG